MPKKNGIELISEIRKNDLNTIMIMLTAYSSEEYLLSLINLNINHYILKPVVSESLLNGIIKAFGDRLENKIKFTDDIYFNMKKRELYCKDEIIILRKRDKDFLLLLHENRNRVLTYSLIEEMLYVALSISYYAFYY